MKVWILLEGYTDNCTYNNDVVYSVHESEEGAFLAEEELKRLQELPWTDRDSDRGSYTSITSFEVKP